MPWEGCPRAHATFHLTHDPLPSHMLPFPACHGYLPILALYALTLFLPLPYRRFTFPSLPTFLFATHALVYYLYTMPLFSGFGFTSHTGFHHITTLYSGVFFLYYATFSVPRPTGLPSVTACLPCLPDHLALPSSSAFTDCACLLPHHSSTTLRSVTVIGWTDHPLPTQHTPPALCLPTFAGSYTPFQTLPFPHYSPPHTLLPPTFGFPSGLVPSHTYNTPPPYLNHCVTPAYHLLCHALYVHGWTT